MSIPFDLEQVINQVGRDKGIDRDVLLKALESAVLSAAKKHYGHNRNIEASYNPELGEIEVLEFKTVVENVSDPENQMSIEEACREFGIDCEIGEELGRKLDASDLGRIAAQTAKQVIMQKIRDAERDIIFNEFKDRKGELRNGIVQRFERGNIVVNLGQTDAILPEREQIPKEHYRQNDRVRAMILDIDPASRGPQVVLSRSHPDFLKELFRMEVPEISEGIIEVKAVAREAGERAKIAVYSNDAGVDPRGACIGIKGSRVQNVVSELRGERIEIILWSSDAPSFVARALSPADVQRVIVDEDEHAMEVVVGDDQLSLAIGRGGQNVKLASKLTGWRIDVRSESVAEEESRRARKDLESIPGIGFGEAELLFQEGYQSVNDVAVVSLEELASVEGIDRERVEMILQGAKDMARAKQMEPEASDVRDQEDLYTDIHQLILAERLRDVLISCGYDKIQDLAALDVSQIVEATGFSEEDAQTVHRATEAFLRYKV